MSELVPYESCRHPEVQTTGPNNYGDVVLQCTECGKKIAIPLLTLTERGNHDLHGIIHMAFGGDWAERLVPLLYNVRYFGAKGDGFADDTEAIQRALNAAGKE